jgi:hypothetical protein
MYYRHEVVVKLSIDSIKDTVSREDVRRKFMEEGYTYDVVESNLITPVSVIEALIKEVEEYRNISGTQRDAMTDVLIEAKGKMEEFQECYEDAL